MIEIINYIRVYRYYKNPKLVENPARAINRLSALTYEKNSHKANLIAGLIKKLRAIAPYQVKDFSEAKKLYEDYFKMENHIESISEIKKLTNQEVFVTRFRNEVPVKGKRFCEYYINGQFGSSQSIFKITSDCIYVDSIKLNSFLGSYCYLSDDNLTQYRYSTPEEISNYKRAEELIRKNNEQIDKLNAEVRRLSKENNTYSNFKF